LGHFSGKKLPRQPLKPIEFNLAHFFFFFRFCAELPLGLAVGPDSERLPAADSPGFLPATPMQAAGRM
jgi:hypothetical protein